MSENFARRNFEVYSHLLDVAPVLRVGEVVLELQTIQEGLDRLEKKEKSIDTSFIAALKTDAP